MRASIVLLCFALACGGKAQRSGEATGGGKQSAAGAQNAAGEYGAAGAPSTAGAGGAGSQCDDSSEPCLAGCSPSDIDYETSCENGHWTCPVGMTPLSACPPGTCVVQYGGCCPPGTNVSLPMNCGATGYALGCPLRSTITEHPGQACAMPDYCDVDGPSQLAGAACPSVNAICPFPNGCGGTTCLCTQANDDKPTWLCTFEPCTKK